MPEHGRRRLRAAQRHAVEGKQPGVARAGAAGVAALTVAGDTDDAASDLLLFFIILNKPKPKPNS